jgi:hypothetical protein
MRWFPGNDAAPSASATETTKRTAMPQMEGQRIVETATEARAAKPGRPVLYVLLASTLAVIVIFALVYLGFFAHT